MTPSRPVLEGMGGSNREGAIDGSDAVHETKRDFAKLKIADGCIHFFVYSQDGAKIPWKIVDTHPNRLFVDWLQVHDSPTTGTDAESIERRSAAFKLSDFTG